MLVGVRGVALTAVAVFLSGALAGCMSTPRSVSGESEPTVTRTVTVTKTVAPTNRTSTPSSGGTSASANPDAAVTHALAQLAKLPVKGRAPKTGYDRRKQFGVSWTDDVPVQFGHNGCDTRNDILRRDLHGITLKPNTHGCVVLTGVLADPYTGARINFQRGVGTSNAIQIDHVVALSDAWQKGAQQLSAQQRQDLANDPRNLLAVQGRANEQKRDGDAATWLPKNKAYRCTYVSKQVAVKSDYHLWVTKAEKEAIERVLSKCA